MKYKGKIAGLILGLIITGNFFGMLIVIFLGHFLFDDDAEIYQDNCDIEDEDEMANIFQLDIVSSILQINLNLLQISGKIFLQDVKLIRDFFKEKFYFSKQEIKQLDENLNSFLYKDKHISDKKCFSHINNYCSYEEKIIIIELLFHSITSKQLLSNNELSYIQTVAHKIALKSSDYEKLFNHYTTDISEYFKTLCINENSTIQEIKTAYRKLAAEYHPDKNTQNYDKEKFQAVVNAYNELKKIKKFS